MGWVFSLNHKRIGIIYSVVGIWGGFLGLGLSVLIRMKFLNPYSSLVPSEVYNYVVTSHGITMVFFFLMPLLVGGFGKFLLPLLTGKDDLDLPRLKGLSL